MGKPLGGAGRKRCGFMVRRRPTAAGGSRGRKIAESFHYATVRLENWKRLHLVSLRALLATLPLAFFFLEYSSLRRLLFLSPFDERGLRYLRHSPPTKRLYRAFSSVIILSGFPLSPLLAAIGGI
ncbi:Hypothetical protein NTJ_08859 [Nesidiocoris tenuis]|uniref:Uncharacterized protein n=1 Tax=Nesidiocoris tenuis TaxID=355587 RepID=A0ABN7AV41_9HEMI|nr:Hypothetical protein NTJ_08859 [Nesidiocoris tenuis]